MSSAEPVPPALLRRLWLGVAGAALFFAATAIQGAVREDYDPWHQAVSALSLGPGGWVQSLNFSAFGLLLIATAPSWRRALAGAASADRFAAYLTAAGVAFMALALVPQDPAPGYDPAGLQRDAPSPMGLVHLAIAGVAGFSLTAGLFILARRFDRDPHWAGWRRRARGTACLMIVLGTVYGVWSRSATGYAGTFEQLALMLPFAFQTALLRRMGQGVPFMVPAARHEQLAATTDGQAAAR